MAGFQAFHNSAFQAFINSGFQAFGPGGSPAALWKLDFYGGLIWKWSPGITLQHVRTNSDGVHVRGKAAVQGDSTIWQLDVDKNVQWDFADGGDTEDAALFIDSGYLYAVTERNNYYTGASPTTARNLWRFATTDGSLDYAAEVTGPSGAAIDLDGVYADGNDAWVRARDDGYVIRIDATDGSVVWRYGFGDVCHSGFIRTSLEVGLAGKRNDQWDDASGNQASIVYLNSAGVYQWHFDTGGDVFTIPTSGAANLYFGGERTNSWTGSGGSDASIWCLNTSGTVVWTFDTGSDVFAIFEDPSNGDIVALGKDNGTYNVWRIDNAGSLVWAYSTGEDEPDAPDYTAGIFNGAVRAVGFTADYTILVGYRTTAEPYVSVWYLASDTGTLWATYDTGGDTGDISVMGDYAYVVGNRTTDPIPEEQPIAGVWHIEQYGELYELDEADLSVVRSESKGGSSNWIGGTQEFIYRSLYNGSDWMTQRLDVGDWTVIDSRNWGTSGVRGIGGSNGRVWASKHSSLGDDSILELDPGNSFATVQTIPTSTDSLRGAGGDDAIIWTVGIASPSGNRYLQKRTNTGELIGTQAFTNPWGCGGNRNRVFNTDPGDGKIYEREVAAPFAVIQSRDVLGAAADAWGIGA